MTTTVQNRMMKKVRNRTMYFNNPLTTLGGPMELGAVPFGSVFAWHNALMVKRKWTDEEPHEDYKEFVPAVCICELNSRNGNLYSGKTIKMKSTDHVQVVGVVKETRYVLNI